MRLNWTKGVWNTLSIPRHEFITWVAAWKRMKTKERLAKVGVIADDICIICGQTPNTHAHLFFQCHFSSQCMQKIKDWMGIARQWRTLSEAFRRIQKKGQQIQEECMANGSSCCCLHSMEKQERSLESQSDGNSMCCEENSVVYQGQIGSCFT